MKELLIRFLLATEAITHSLVEKALRLLRDSVPSHSFETSPLPTEKATTKNDQWSMKALNRTLVVSFRKAPVDLVDPYLLRVTHDNIRAFFSRRPTVYRPAPRSLNGGEGEK